MNHLAHSTSPYLLQHANNPVNWHAWGEEALSKARDEDKPIFLSIGYAACHWCHVMAHESFEDPATAVLMNEHFVNIKVDREERPDLDGIYMQAVMALTGSGGWPMSVFLTPDLHPFYGGTYFPPTPRHNLPAFRDVLNAVAEAWKARRAEIENVGGQLVAQIQAQTAPITGTGFTPELLEAVEKNTIDAYDWGYGGWGGAPKFPQAMTIEFLLARHHTPGQPSASLRDASRSPKGEGSQTPSPSEGGRGENAAVHALKAMARGGMYDVVGGGFARYSTDNFWRVPHFEKMLYDNALLTRAYLHAYQITGEPAFREVVEDTIAFVRRELTHPDGGLYSSLDADSEGEEGKYYVWTKEEIRETIADDSEFEFFSATYGISEKGNWEGKTVLQRASEDSSVAINFGLSEEEASAILDKCHKKLLAVRGKRIRPATDDKVLTAWNGLMLAAIAEAARTPRLAGVGVHSGYLEMATRNADFLLTSLCPGGKPRRAWRNGQTTEEVFLEDYAALILGLVELYQADFNKRWFTAAMTLAEEMIRRFSDPTGGFFDTPADGESLLMRPKDLQDNATPSGNALATEALLKLAALSGRGDFRELAEKALDLASTLAIRFPTGFARWLSAAEFGLAKVKQVGIIISKDGQGSAQGLIEVVREKYRPNLVTAAAIHPPEADTPALLGDRPLVEGKSAAYVCEGFICKRPVTTPDELRQML